MTVATLPFPATCPDCGRATVIRQPHLICPNPVCGSKIVGLLVHAAKRSNLDINGLGDEVAEALVRAGSVTNLADLFTLEANKLAGMAYGKSTFGTTRANKLYTAIQGAKQRPWNVVLHSLGCPGLGEPQADLIAEKYSLYDLIAVLSPVEVKMGLLSLKGIAEKTAIDFVTWMQASADWLFVICEHLQTVPAPVETRNQPLLGYSVVMTGKMTGGRDSYKKRFKALGAAVSDSVSKTTTILFAGPDAVGTDKYKSAEKHNVPIQTEDQLVQLLKEHE